MTPEEREAEITALKSLLADTDYNAAQLIESLVRNLRDVKENQLTKAFAVWLSDTIKSYAPIVDKREEWREKIRELEEET